MQQLDVSAVISGLEEARFIHDEALDAPMITKEDFDEATPDNITPLSVDQKHYFVLKGQLAQLGARFLSLSSFGLSHASMVDVRELGRVMEEWHNDLPRHFAAISSDEKGQGILALTISVTSLQYQLLFFQALILCDYGTDKALRTWIDTRMKTVAFELASTFRLALVHDLAQRAPPTL
jgi:hypothetical protein